MMADQAFNDLYNNLIYINRVGEWKLIRGCPGFLTDWYNTTEFHFSSDNPDEGIVINGTHYFLFNLKGETYFRSYSSFLINILVNRKFSFIFR